MVLNQKNAGDLALLGAEISQAFCKAINMPERPVGVKPSFQKIQADLKLTLEVKFYIGEFFLGHL